jgi:hypothetical protein
LDNAIAITLKKEKDSSPAAMAQQPNAHLSSEPFPGPAGYVDQG